MVDVVGTKSETVPQVSAQTVAVDVASGIGVADTVVGAEVGVGLAAATSDGVADGGLTVVGVHPIAETHSSATTALITIKG